MIRHKKSENKLEVSSVQYLEVENGCFASLEEVGESWYSRECIAETPHLILTLRGLMGCGVKWRCMM
jgi:hypothetical protein